MKRGPKIGHIVTEETRIRMGNSHRGKKHTEVSRLKMSMSQKLRFSKGPAAFFGRKHSEETKRKMREKRKLQIFSPETCAKISRSHLGKVPWNKGTKGLMKAWNKGRIGIYHHSKEACIKMGNSRRGKKHTIETRRKMSEKNKLRVLNGTHPWWKGGLNKEHLKIRSSLESKLWREAVFARDGYACIWCGAKTFKGLGKRVTLNADHIKPFCDYPELRFSVDNGRTLCVDCHRKTITYGVNKPKKNEKNK